MRNNNKKINTPNAAQAWKIISERLKAIDTKNIYDDVAALQADVESLWETVMDIFWDYLPMYPYIISDEDLNDQIGAIFICYGNNCQNRPSGLNGYLINIPHPTMYDRYNIQFWFTRPKNNVYTRTMEDGVWGDWVPLHYDTGWQNLPLADGIIVANEQRPVQYRRINNEVFIRGGIRGVSADNTVIGTLPSGYRPPSGFYAVQMTQHTAGEGKNTPNFWRMNIRTNGEVVMQQTTNPAHSASHWYDLDTQFLMD